MSQFGKLKRVELRKGWRHEALDFTQWLVKEENLKMLGDELGIELLPIEAEAKAGRYSVDILAEEENTGKHVIIENQLEKTDHDHLGKIITYASGYDAEYVVWVVKDAHEEHRQAMEWLNDHTGNDLNFFLIRLELWQIDESAPAVKLNTLVKPNEWTKTIRERARTGELTDTKLLQLDFWNNFKSYCQEVGSSIGNRKAFPQHWYDFSIGSSEGHVSLTLNTRENALGCEFYIHQNKDLYDELNSKKVVIEQELGSDLEWMRLDDKKASRIKRTRIANLEDTDSWEEYHKWLVEQGERFREVFRKHI